MLEDFDLNRILDIIFQFSRDILRQNETHQAAVLIRSKLLIDRHCP